MKKLIGTVPVINGGLNPQTVFIQQDIRVDAAGTITHAEKFFTLDSKDGERVYPTTDPAVLKLADGTVLKRTGTVQLVS